MNAQMRYFANLAFLPQGWAENVLLTVDQAGWISDLQINTKAEDAIRLTGPVLPGMPNLHSHAFQYAMAGLAEHASAAKECFWTWRALMYRFLEKIRPEDLQAIAAALYVDMLKAGYTSVAEFQYLHHQSNGQAYQDRALLSHHLIGAAQESGIAITLLPVLYAYADFGGQPPLPGQQRFINNEDALFQIRSLLDKAYKNNPQVSLGFALHSLRAVNPAMLASAIESIQVIDAASPIHIHIAEQIKEVEDCLRFSGHRPVDWLLNHARVDAHWCLVHATHMTEEETRALALTGAVAGLCPTTEANLGDGFFNLPDYIQHGGVLGIGSDSHISLNMIEELRWLEYGQRLVHQQRMIGISPKELSVGGFLYQQALKGGNQALGRLAGELAVGRRADFIVLDEDNPSFFAKAKSEILDTMIFASNANPIRHVFVAGQQLVKDFRHLQEEAIYARYKKTMLALR